MTVHRTLELDEAADARLEELASVHGVSVTDLMLESVERILAEDQSFVAGVQRGMADVAAGRVFSHEQVLERSQKRRQELLARARK